MQSVSTEFGRRKVVIFQVLSIKVRRQNASGRKKVGSVHRGMSVRKLRHVVSVDSCHKARVDTHKHQSSTFNKLCISWVRFVLYVPAGCLSCVYCFARMGASLHVCRWHRASLFTTLCSDGAFNSFLCSVMIALVRKFSLELCVITHPVPFHPKLSSFCSNLHILLTVGFTKDTRQTPHHEFNWPAKESEVQEWKGQQRANHSTATVFREVQLHAQFHSSQFAQPHDTHTVLGTHSSNINHSNSQQHLHKRQWNNKNQSWQLGFLQSTLWLEQKRAKGITGVMIHIMYLSCYVHTSCFLYCDRRKQHWQPRTASRCTGSLGQSQVSGSALLFDFGLQGQTDSNIGNSLAIFVLVPAVLQTFVLILPVLIFFFFFQKSCALFSLVLT